MEHRIQTSCLLLLSAIAVAGAMHWLKPVMIPFVLALFISLGLTPLIDFQMRRLRLPRPLSLLATLVLAVLILAGLAVLVWASAGQLAANASSYQAQFRQLMQRVLILVPLELPELAGAGEFRALSQIPVSTVGSMLVGTTNAIAQTLSSSLLVLIFVIFLLLARREGAHGSAAGMWREIEARITNYLLIKVALSAMTGLLVGLVLALLGVPLALAFGLFAFLLNFVPNLGSLIATLLPLPVVLVTPEISASVAVLAIVLPGTVQLTVGNFIEPRLMGGSLDLHPVAILLALIFWGMLWGMVGMLLAAPMTAILKILCERIEPTRPIAELLAGRTEALWSGTTA